MSNPEILGTRLRELSCFGRLKEHGGKLLTFSEEEIAKFYLKTKTTKIQLRLSRNIQDLLGVTNKTVI